MLQWKLFQNEKTKLFLPSSIVCIKYDYRPIRIVLFSLILEKGPVQMGGAECIMIRASQSETQVENVEC